MLERISAFFAISITAMLLVSLPAAAQAFGCSKELEVANLCSIAVANDGSSIEVDAARTVPGSNPGSSIVENDALRDRRPSSPLRDRLCERSVTHLRLCPETSTPADPSSPPSAAPGVPAITITDLAQFAPAATPLAGEPANLGIAGMPTNFIAPASVTTASGTLFGLPLTVRFTPSAYEFHFGDGSDATTTTGGQSWEALGQAQFTPTATSHVYRDRGSYSAYVDVRYTAEVDLGTGWIPVAGELTADGPTQEIRIFEASTALVAYTCDQKPSSPGC